MKEDELMKEQSRFIVCRASAGSGKTFELVLVYLTLAFSVDDTLGKEHTTEELQKRFGRILAITFTNKAVNEMKERILKDLAEISADSENRPNIEKHLCKRTGLPVDEVRWRAGVVYDAILHNYGNFAVCTIDSFLNRIVRTFARDLGLPENFDLELNSNVLTDTVTDNLMSRIGCYDKEDLTKIIETYGLDSMAEESGYSIDSQIKNMVPQVLSEGAPKHIDKLKDLNTDDYIALHKEFIDANKLFEVSLSTIAQKALAEINEHKIDHSKFYGGGSGPKYFQNIIAKNFDDPSKRVIDFFDPSKNKLGSSDCDAETSEKIASIKDHLISAFNEIELLRKEGVTAYNTRRMLLPNIYKLGLIKRIYDEVELYYHENNSLHISELNKRLSNEIVKSEDAIYLYERVGNVYDNILIDEFQDTSELQWGNLAPLIDNILSLGHTALIVGDEKQAIYRWRNGNVQQFMRLPEVSGRDYPNMRESFSPMEKSTNFRSMKNVVETNNKFFEFAVNNGYADNNILETIYIGNPQKEPDSDPKPKLKQDYVNDNGYVKMTFVNNDSELYEPVVAEIEHQHELGFNYNEICVMAHKHKHLSAVADILASKGISFVSSDSMKLAKSNIVNTILSVLSAIASPNDLAKTHLALLRMQSLGLIDNSYEQIMMQTKSKDEKTLDIILNKIGIDLHINELKKKTLYDCCEELLRTLNPKGLDNAYTMKLLNVVANYSQHNRQNLQEFLDWINLNIKDISINFASSEDSVILMTTHTAKGLQWPIVLYILPTPHDKPDPIWVDINDPSIKLPVGLVTVNQSKPSKFRDDFTTEKHLSNMDKMNVLYVAMTRPEEKLFTYTTIPTDTKGNTTLNKLLFQFAEKEKEKEKEEVTFMTKVPDHKIYYRGDNHKKTDKKSDKNKSDKPDPTKEVLTNLSFPDYHNRINYAKHANTEKKESSEQQYGNLMHDILSHIFYKDDIQPTLQRYKHRLSDDQYTKIEQQITNMVNDDKCSRFFDKNHEILTECPLIFTNIEGRIERRPDRIVKTINQTWIVDFKTGEHESSYKSQVLDYCNAITQIGLPNPRGFLLYIGDDGCHLEEVNP